MAHPSAVEDQGVMNEYPGVLRKEGFEIVFHSVRMVLTAETQPLREPGHVGIDCDGGTAEGGGQYNVCGLPSHPWKGKEGVKVIRNNTPMVCHQFPRHQNDIACFGPVETDVTNQ